MENLKKGLAAKLKCNKCGRWRRISHHVCYIPPHRQCWKCGSNTTRMKSKYPVWRRYESHTVCELCYSELHKKGRFRIPKDRRCILCGTDKSGEKTSGQNHWYSYGDGFVCITCNRVAKGVRPRHEYLSSIRIPPDRKCSKCGSFKTEVDKKGQAHWAKDGNGGYWCRTCYRREHMKDPKALEKRRARGKRAAKKRRDSMTKEEHKALLRYLAEYRQNPKNKAKALAYSRLPEVRAKDLERKKLPEMKVKRNKRLKANRYFSTNYPYGYSGQQEFKRKVANLISDSNVIQALVLGQKVKDPLTIFLESYIVMDQRYEITKNEFYERFTDFCKIKGFDIDTRRMVNRKLIMQHKWIDKRQGVKKGRYYVWKHVKFKPAA